MLWCSGALSSDQRVLLTQRPCGVWERSWAFHSSRRTWSTARAPSRTTWKGSKQISASGTSARIARWYSPLMSIETARIDSVASPSSEKKGLQRGAGAARGAPHDGAGGAIGDGGEAALTAAIGDLIDAEEDQALEPVLIEFIGDDAGDDRDDRVPADSKQAGDRRERHLLRQPRDHVLEVARVRRAR